MTQKQPPSFNIIAKHFFTAASHFKLWQNNLPRCHKNPFHWRYCLASMKRNAELSKNRMRKCEKGTGFTWMLNKSAQSSCHCLTCALFVCGYCLSLGVAGGEMSVCSLLTAFSLCQTSLGHASETSLTHTNAAFHESVYKPPTHSQTPAQPMSFWSLNLLSVSL